jgi:four helix bundle protein
MATVKRFEDLDAWKTSRQLANHIYDITSEDPFARDFGLRDQIQRAAVSVMSNIAEGFNSRTQRIFIDLLGRARGSAAEVQSQLYLALDRAYIVESQFNDGYELADKVSRQIYRLVRYLESTSNASRVREEGVAYELTLAP